MRAIIFCALAAFANAASISWTGIANDNQWFNHINWSPDQVPGPNDDVTIPSGVVQVTQATGVNSLQMGTMVAAPANLTLFQAFVVGNGGMQVSANGNLIINTGLQTVYGQVEIGGNLEFIDGTIGGQWTIDSRASANLGNANMKGFSACQFVCKGQLSLGGVLQLNQSSVIELDSATASNVPLTIQNGDNTAVNFDASKAAFTYSVGTLIVQAPMTIGQFSLLSGNLTILDSMNFTDALHVPANSYVDVLGNTNLQAPKGFTGQGVVSIGCTSATIGGAKFDGFLNVIGGAAIFSTEGSIGVFTIAGGNAVFMAQVSAKHFTLLSGTTAGTGFVATENLLISTKGFTLGAAIVANGTITLAASVISFGTAGALTIKEGANATITGAVLLTGPAAVPGVTNNGNILALSTLSSQNINLQGSGSVTAANKVSISTATFSQSAVRLSSGATFTGTNSFLTVGKIVNAQGGAVKAVIGSYSFTCPAECDNVNTPSSNPPTSAFTFSA